MSDYRMTAEFFERCTEYPCPNVGDVVSIRGRGLFVIAGYDPDTRVYNVDRYRPNE